jgi:predicted GH43/DUF377 family glycosyl hydrolase
VVVELAHRTGHRLAPDPRRVITQLFVPGEEQLGSQSRANGVLARVLALSEAEVTELVAGVVGDFRGRHRDLMRSFSDNFAVIDPARVGPRRLSAERRVLIGACFTKEFAPEGAALFNPSMVAHPDQSGVGDGEVRFLLSVRCLGEGHISSIGFRTGTVGPGSAMRLDDTPRLLGTGAHRGAAYFQRAAFLARIADLGAKADDVDAFASGLPETFTPEQLADRLTAIHQHTLNRQRGQQVVNAIAQVSAATYDIEFADDTSVGERLLWPSAPVESHGMEDARLVRFVEDDGSVTYYGTYTAYDGVDITPQLLATKEFRQFHFSPVAGWVAQNKGMALFPRRVGGRYVALSRWDRESTSISFSDDPRIWIDSSPLHQPRNGWEVIQVGNCGPPIETPDGWLVLTHGVGPMRVYGIGAILLDLADPSIVRATLARPLLTAGPTERDGYVPNVVYSCGALLHDDVLTIPYGISDRSIGFAQTYLSELLGHMDPA